MFHLTKKTHTFIQIHQKRIEKKNHRQPISRKHHIFSEELLGGVGGGLDLCQYSGGW